MRSYDLSPLFRSTIGFDRWADLFEAANRVNPSASAFPPYNIEKRGDEAYRITMAVAGFGESDIEVTVQENLLVISGKLEDSKASEISYLHRGIAARVFERRFNLALQLSEEEFLKYASQPPAKPLNMTAILAANRGEASFPWPQVAHDMVVPSIGITEVVPWLQERQAYIIDVREPQEFADGHIPNALSVPQSELAISLADVPKDSDVLVECAGGNRSLRSAGFLKAVGYTRVTNLDGGTNGWREAGNPIETVG